MSSSHNEYDSSDDEYEEDIANGATSATFLGFVDAPITLEDEPSIEDSFIGGKPLWFDPSSPPPSEYLLCKVCNSPMALLSQSFAPFGDALYDRIIYVFSCKSPSCRRKKGSIRAIRAVQKDPLKMKQVQLDNEKHLQKDLEQKLKLEEQKKFEIEATKNLFDNDTKSSNPFGNGSDNSNPFTSNPFASTTQQQQQKDSTKQEVIKPTFASVAQKAAKDISKDTTPKNDVVTLKEFPGYFIYVDEEKFKKVQKDDVKMTSKIEDLDESVLDTEFDESDSKNKSSSGPDTTNPEALKIASMMEDPVFGNFSEKISHNSQQVLRYDLGGIPLLYSSKDDIYRLFYNKDKQLKIPNPGYNPSSSRQFEFQLMPKLILDLEKDHTDILNGMEWGTIIVCTDVEDYMPKLDDNNVGYVEEWCGVQWEEEIKR